jgi:hypothetical protein
MVDKRKASLTQAEDEQLDEDVYYWANLFQASPAEVANAMETVTEHPEPEDPTELPRSISADRSEPRRPA